MQKTINHFVVGHLDQYRRLRFLLFFSYRNRLSYLLTKNKLMLLLFPFVLTSLLVVFLTINLALVVVQKDRMPLNARVQNINLSLKTPDEAKKLLQKLESQALNIDANGNSLELKLNELGMSIDADSTIHELNQGSGIYRLPLIKAISFKMTSQNPKYNFDKDKAISVFQSIGEKYSMPSVNATITLPQTPEGEIIIEPEKQGFSVDAQLTADQLINSMANVLQSKNLALKPGHKNADVTSKSLKPEQERLQKLMKFSTSLQYGDQRFEPDSGQRLSFLQIALNENGQARGVYNKENIKAYINNVISPKVYKAPGSTVINILDGAQSTQSIGAQGLTINADETADAYISSWQDEQPTVEVKTQIIEPKTIYNKTYSHTDAGLSMLLSDFASSYRGEYQIFVKDLSGGISASLNASTSTVPASTYKVFLAFVTFKKVEQGSLSINMETGSGSVLYCIEQMIVISDNTCAKALLNTIGWGEVDRVLHEAGFNSTNLNNSAGDYMSTNAQDVANIMERLYNGSLISNGNRDILFGFMGRQIYRSGIPAGSHGSAVIDKVGFLEGWNHDMAIVYSPSSTYILVVMTKNSSFSNISTLASKVHDFFN